MDCWWSHTLGLSIKLCERSLNCMNPLSLNFACMYVWLASLFSLTPSDLPVSYYWSWQKSLKKRSDWISWPLIFQISQDFADCRCDVVNNYQDTLQGGYDSLGPRLSAESNNARAPPYEGVMIPEHDCNSNISYSPWSLGVWYHVLTPHPILFLFLATSKSVATCIVVIR